MIEVGHIKINESVCKGCGICIAFCPKQVYITKKSKPYPLNPDACIKCRLCELRCPDFAIIIGGGKD